MKKVRFTELVKFVAFMATLAGSLEGSGSRGETDRGETKKLSARRSSCSLVLVSTLDGKLSALDARNNGKLRWSLPAFSGPLLSSSLSSAQVAKHMRLIPSLDGALYQVNGDKVEPIPFSADTLLGSFYTLPDASILVGGKEAISCGIDPHSGKVRYICSADGCQLTDSEGQVQNSDVLVIKRTQQTIRAVDQRSGVERWNFSVGQQDLSFLGAAVNDGGENHCPDPDEELPMEWSLRVSVPNGLVAAVHTHGMGKAATNNVVLWSQKFESPVAAVWRLNGDLIKQVDLLSKEVMPELSEAPAPDVFPRRPVMYIGKYEGQVYIQTSELFDPAVNTAQRVGAGLSSNAVARQSREVIWKPYLTSSPSRTPTVVTKDLAVWNPMDYPFDNGFYLYGEVLPVIPPHNKDNQLLVVDPDPGAAFERNKHNSSESTIDGNEDSVWWHGVAFVTVAVAVVVQFLINFLHGANRRKLEAVVDYKRMPSNTLTAMSSTASLETIKGPPTPTSLGSTNSLTPSNSFVSRYLTDFEHERCLGKGGFGLVFQAKNKVDDCRYAIKRIRLPNCEQAREKVMREVKALAKLEHPGIVRYFQSWFEAPPIGWQEEIDTKMHEQGTYCGLPSESPSFGSGIVMNVHVPSTDDLYIGQQASSCGDDLQDLVNNFVRRRRKSCSISRSGYSSYNTNGKNEDDASERINGEVFDIHQLENKAFLVGQENSDSISIEFHSSSNSGLIQPKNGFFGSGGMEDSASHSVIFQDSGASENKVVSVESISFTSNSCDHSDSTQSSSSKDCCFNSSHHSLLSREGHKCQNTECNADRLSAPLYLYIQMQLCQQESLKDWLRATTKRSHVYCLNVFEQILCAVEYFHDRGLMHRDLKPSNIFFSLDGSVKVGDFGLVTAHSSENNSDTPIKDTNAFIDDINHTGQVGTQLYMSPEQIEGKAYSHKVDIFSLGLIFFELFCPFSTQMERIKVMRDVKKRVFPGDFEVKMPLQAELVRWLLSTTPKARPHATEVKNSVILRQIRQNSLNLEPQG